MLLEDPEKDNERTFYLDRVKPATSPRPKMPLFTFKDDPVDSHANETKGSSSADAPKEDPEETAKRLFEDASLALWKKAQCL